jgi:hypothetical protein
MITELESVGPFPTVRVRDNGSYLRWTPVRVRDNGSVVVVVRFIFLAHLGHLTCILV